MADFSKAHREVMGNEGGYANNPADTGGETYKGIARKHHPSWAGWVFIDKAKKTVTKQPAYGTSSWREWVRQFNAVLQCDNTLQGWVLSFYRANFWDANRCGDVVDQRVATWLYDHVVNAGGRGAKWMQEAAGVKADGAIGPKSIAAINAADPAQLLQEAEDVAAFYRLDRAVADASQIQFLPSWLRRDGVSKAEIDQVMKAAKDGLTYAEAVALKSMIQATA